MTLLPRPLELRANDGTILIRDCEAFCTRILQTHAPHNPPLTYHQREWVLARLIYATVELAHTYQPGIIQKGFTTWAGIHLTHDLHDILRTPEARAEGLPGRTKWTFTGRTYERPRIHHVPLDHLDHTNAAGHQLAGRTHHTQTPEDRDIDFIRALRTPNSPSPQPPHPHNHPRTRSDKD